MLSIFAGSPVPDRVRDPPPAVPERSPPEETPAGGPDLRALSSFGIDGGNIENVALTPSYLAAEDDTGRVEMDHVVRALRRELGMTGRLVNPEEFGEYREQLQ